MKYFSSARPAWWRAGLAGALLWVAGHAAAAQTLTLPVEVLGAEGTTQTVTLNVPGGSAATGLWLQVNNLSYADKGSVKINDGAWVSLNNGTVLFSERQKNMGGIGGSYSAFGTIKLTVPVAGAVKDGSNTVAFRFNKSDGVSIGFRVLKLNFVDAGGRQLMPASAFADDDPATWSAPQNNAAAIAAGEELWETATLKESYLSGSRTLKAKCGDCHARKARDLKYFAYSNHSIIERAKFHGLSQDEAEKIASFVRALKQKQPGRPWNPPYQPGPGLESKPVDEWAAGAGIDAVLDKDADGLPYLFPKGITAEGFDLNGKFNPREIPNALMLPDWKHWLPRVHMKDMGLDYDNSAARKSYDDIRGKLQAGGTYKTDRNGFEQDDDDWGNNVYELLKPVPRDKETTRQSASFIYSAAQWRVVKLWELHQEFSMEGLGQQKYGTTDGEPRQWLTGDHYVLFTVSPFMLKIDADVTDENNLIGGSRRNSEYSSNMWYQLTILINLGGRVPGVGGIAPYDWAYAYGKYMGLQFYTNESEPVRFFTQIIAGIQAINNGIKPGYTTFPGGGDRSWSPRISGFDMPTELHWLAGGGVWKDLSPALRKQLIDAYLGAYLKKARQWPVSEYVGDLIDDENTWPMHDYKLGSSQVAGGRAPDRLYTALPRYAQLGASCQVINDIVDWCAEMWPNNNWDPIRIANCSEKAPTGPQLAIISPKEGGFYNQNEPLTLTALPGSFPQAVTAVEYFEGDQKLGAGTGANYQLTLGTVTPGLHTLEARARDAGGNAVARTVHFLVGDKTCSLTGTPLGATEAFDGNPDTNLPEGTTSIGYDFGAGNAQRIGLFAFLPLANENMFANTALVITGAKLQGSNTSATAGFVDLYTVGPPVAGWNYASVSDPTKFRYVRLLKPDNQQDLRLLEMKLCVGVEAGTTPVSAPEPAPAPTTTLRVPENPSGTVAGLDYKYYQGTWDQLPDFAALTAAKTGTVTNFDLSPRTQDDNFGFRYTGYVDIAADGQYTFYTSSDDGSRLYIGSTLVVDNDGLHGVVEKSGAIGLRKGKHAITVVFFERGGGQELGVSYSSASLSKTLIPASALFRDGGGSTPAPTPAPTAATTDYEAEKGTWGGGGGQQDAGNASGGQLVGNLNAEGAYSQVSGVAGGSGGSATVVVRYSNGNSSNRSLSLYANGVFAQRLSFPPTGGWNTFATVSTSVSLNAGTGNTLKLQRDAADLAAADVDKFSVTTGGTAKLSVATAKGAAAQRKAGPDAGRGPTASVYPNPLVGGVGLVRFELSEPQSVGCALYDRLGRVVWASDYRHAPAGVYQLELDGRKLAAGTYFLHMNVGPQVLRQQLTIK